MTITESTTPIAERGRVITHTAGTGALLMPVPDSGGQQWLYLNPGTHTIETARLDAVSLRPDTTTDDEILTGLVTAWQSTHQRLVDATRRAHRLDATIEEIREYAIDKHRDGHYCREGLNEALEHFGLDPYHPRYTARFTIIATAEFNADSEDDAHQRLQHLIDGIAFPGDDLDDDLEIDLSDIEIDSIDRA